MSAHQDLARAVSNLKPGEALTVTRDVLTEVESLRHNGATWTGAERVLENVVGSAYTITMHEDHLGRVTFQRLSEAAAEQLLRAGGRTYVSPDRRDRFVLRDGAFFPRTGA